MKLSFSTYQVGAHWGLPKILETARACGFAGIELLTEFGHDHGVELSISKERRREFRHMIEDSYLELVCLTTPYRFQWPDPAQRKEHFDKAVQSLELASDLGCRRIRVLGDRLVEGVTREDLLRWVTENLRGLAEAAEPYGIDVLLEMHGDFTYWGFARHVMEKADHPRLGLIYNCPGRRDEIGGSISAVYSHVKPWIRYVHMHSFVSGFNYAELFELLKRDGYDGYFASEISPEVPTPEDYLATYAALFRALAGLPFYAPPSPPRG